MYSQACISINKTRNGVISEKQINKWKDAFSKYILNLVLSSVSFSRSFFSAGIRRRNSYVHSFLGIGLGLGFPFSLSHTHTHTPIHIVSFNFRSSFAMPQIQYSEKYFDDVYEYRCVHQKFSPSPLRLTNSRLFIFSTLNVKPCFPKQRNCDKTMGGNERK